MCQNDSRHVVLAIKMSLNQCNQMNGMEWNGILNAVIIMDAANNNNNSSSHKYNNKQMEFKSTEKHIYNLHHQKIPARKIHRKKKLEMKRQ